MSHSIRTCLWFRDGRGREAAEFYCGLISGSRVDFGRDGRSGRDRQALGSAHIEWWRGKSLRLAQGSLWGVMAGFPKALDRTDLACRPKCVCQGVRRDDEANED